MKEITTTVLAVLTALLLIAQTPQAFKYQAVCRDTSGNVLVTQDVSFRISILQESVSGANVYTETHDTITNEFGMVNLEIGNGTIVSGNFFAIEWGDNLFFLQVEMDETGETNYQLLGISQLMSVPYALHAGKSEDGTQWETDGSDIIYQEGNVGIGTDNPNARLEVSSLLRLTPSAIPGDCDGTLEGSIFYNDVLNKFCFCNGEGWMQLDGTGSCECIDQDNDGYDICDPNHPADTDGFAADCDDQSPGTYPGASEECDGIDNDCNDVIDDNLSGVPCSNQQGVCGGSVRTCGGVSGWIACDASSYGSDYEDTEITCDGLDNDCDGETDEMCALVPHVYSYGCYQGACAIASCDAGWANCNGIYSDGCEVNLNLAPNSCGSPQYLGSHPGDEGSGCGGTDLYEYGHGGYFYRIYMYEDCSGPFDDEPIGIRATLMVPPGMDYDLYLYDDDCNQLGQSSSSSTEYVEHYVNDIVGYADSQYYKIEVRFYSGSSCDDWTLRIQSYN